MKPAIPLFLAVLLMLGMIVSPVSAETKIITTGYFPDAEITFSQENLYNLSYTVNSTDAISNIQIRAPKGTELNYTITYGNGYTLDGFISYVQCGTDLWDLTCGVTTINIGDGTDSREFIDTGLLRKWEIVGYAREEDNDTVISTGYAIYDVSLGIGNIGFQSGFIAYQNVSDIQPLEAFSFTSNTPVFVEIGTADRVEIQEGIIKTTGDVANDWLTQAWIISTSALDFVGSLFAFIVMFFVGGNFILFVLLWLGITMAYSAISSVTSRGFDVFRFYKKFLGFQKMFLEFVIFLWNSLVTIIGTMVQALLKWL